jgi:hypothetical protein
MGLADCEKCWMALCECGYKYKNLSNRQIADIYEAVSKEFNKRLPIRLERKPHNSHMLTNAVLREDGIHFVEHNGQERREVSQHKTITELNQAMRSLDYPEFSVIKERSL